MSIFQKLYDSEINCFVESFWDAGFTCGLGQSSRPVQIAYIGKFNETEIEEILTKMAKKHYPDSKFVRELNESI